MALSLSVQHSWPHCAYYLLTACQSVCCAACSGSMQVSQHMVQGYLSLGYHGNTISEYIDADLLMVQSFKEVKEVMAEFKSKYKLSKVGAQGFCWGGKYTVLLLGKRLWKWAVIKNAFAHPARLLPSRMPLLYNTHTVCAAWQHGRQRNMCELQREWTMHCAGSGDADAGVVCHGSLLNDEDVEAIENPVLFLYSANDQQIPDEKREKFQSILKTKSFPAEGVYYPDQAGLVTFLTASMICACKLAVQRWQQYESRHCKLGASEASASSTPCIHWLPMNSCMHARRMIREMFGDGPWTLERNVLHYADRLHERRSPADMLKLMQAHGWTLRGDDKDPKVGDAAKDAFARALKFFQQHL